MSALKKLIMGDSNPPPDSKAVVRKWTREIQHEIRYMERDIASML